MSQSGKTQMHVTLPDSTEGADGSEQDVTSDQAAAEEKKEKRRTLQRKKSVGFALGGELKVKNDLQRAEKVWMAQTVGLDKHAIESIEKNLVRKSRVDDKIYSLSKGGVGKVVRFFNETPESKPMTVTFNFPSIALTHLHILKLMKGIISPYPEAKVTCLQFVDRNVFHGTRGLENRWIVTLDSCEARDYIVASGLTLFNRVVPIRHYDDVMKEEYDRFMKYTRNQRYLNPSSSKVE